jgi:hypothetical protein
MRSWEGTERDWDYISCFHGENGTGAAPAIDDRTWSDLDLSPVFRKIDRTGSSVGQAVLFDMMRTPLGTRDDFHCREAKILSLMKDDSARQRISKICARLGSQREGEIYSFFTHMGGEMIREGRRYLFLSMGIAAAMSIASVVFMGLPGVLFLAVIAIVNIAVHFSHKARVEVESPSYAYLTRLLGAAEKLGRLDVQGFSRETKELKSISGKLRKLRSRTGMLLPLRGLSGDIVEMLLEYVRIFFLLQVTAYFFSHNETIRRMTDLKAVYGLVGEMDTLAGIAAFRLDNPSCVTPEISDGAGFLEVRDMVHPLIENPVGNSLRMDGKGIILTGSNMSGKSTFLRTLGVNQILASTVCMAYAGSFKCSLFLTVSSITSIDTILGGESRYFVEAKRLLAILRLSEGPRPVFALIDEILSGTSSGERIAASVGILKYLLGKNCLVVTATHERSIALSLEGAYENAHFTHRVDAGREQGLEFDYRLKQGIVEQGNAISLLERIGFPSEITRTLL